MDTDNVEKSACGADGEFADRGASGRPGAPGDAPHSYDGGDRPATAPDLRPPAPQTPEACEATVEDRPGDGQEEFRLLLERDPAQAPFMVDVRCGVFETRLTCAADIEAISAGTRLVIRTDRGTEMAVAISSPRPNRDAVPLRTRVLRKATAADIELQRKLDTEKRAEAYAFASRLIREHRLKMRLAYVEPLLGGEKMVFYFSADARVDFRGLVRDLAREYRTRIEMRQVGPRDEARLMGEYEMCGRRLCCKSFLDKLEPVSMRMAKQQKSTLDPGKISGRCGRLKCCLRFEDKVYAELKLGLPEVGDTVISSSLRGQVISCDIMRQMVTVLTPGGERATVKAGEILFVEPAVDDREKRDREAEEEGRDSLGDKRELPAGCSDRMPEDNICSEHHSSGIPAGRKVRPRKPEQAPDRDAGPPGTSESPRKEGRDGESPGTAGHSEPAH